jgi:hypothetical protein
LRRAFSPALNSIPLLLKKTPGCAGLVPRNPELNSTEDLARSCAFYPWFVAKDEARLAGRDVIFGALRA